MNTYIIYYKAHRWKDKSKCGHLAMDSGVSEQDAIARAFPNGKSLQQAVYAQLHVYDRRTLEAIEAIEKMDI